MLFYVMYICNGLCFSHNFNILLYVTLRVTNKIKLHPLTADVYNKQ